MCIKGCVISYLVRAGIGSARGVAAGGREVRSRTQCTWSGCIASGLTGVLIERQLTSRQRRECGEVIGRNVGTRLNKETFDGGVNPISHRTYGSVGSRATDAGTGSIGGATEVREGGSNRIAGVEVPSVNDTVRCISLCAHA